MHAASMGNPEMVRLVLSHPNINVNHSSNGWTSLFVACIAGRAQVVQELLLCQPVNVEIRDKDGRSARDWARWTNPNLVPVFDQVRPPLVTVGNELFEKLTHHHDRELG
eukprot:c1711_g1_i1.p1 GENE.c1711_g1_i1~~c1711_g1_i1.p1  ORF type:complete len:109 (+),score=10.94 c1711_g1_i1:276-602(+)